ncbi:MAG: class I SAM-dependent DNA methyltransferase [Gammaproteobacteria bacterium]
MNPTQVGKSGRHSKEPLHRDFMMYKLFTTHADHYDRIYLGEKYHRETQFINWLMEREATGKSIIDVACGTGTHINSLCELGYELRGVDLCAEMIAHARRKNPWATITQDDMRTFIAPRKADMIICMYGAFNYLRSAEDGDMALKNFKRNLKDKGTVVIDVRYGRNLPDRIRVVNKNDTIIVTQWLKENDMSGSYKLFYAAPEENVLLYEEHRQYLLDPFWLSERMLSLGFSSVELYEDYDSAKPFTRDSTVHRVTVVGITATAT